MELVKIDRSIFRQYDIRGVYPTFLDENVAYTIGRSFASYIEDKTVIIGRDCRSSSDSLHDALVKGLLESGANIIDIGLVTTPMYYFAKKHLGITNGMMITASHNPKEYNGFKISFSKIGNAFGDDIVNFYNFTDKLEFDNTIGKIEYLDIKDKYLRNFKNSIVLGSKRIKAVFDCGNGTGSIIIKDILDMFNIEYELLYCESDPEFPNHQPDPAEAKNMQDLAKKVVELGYDIGIGIDGDGDRVGLVDDKGNIIGSDLIMLIIYRNIHQNMKKKKAVFDVKCSKTLIDGLNDINLDYELYRTGASYLNFKINSENFDFGGEYAGHLWFNDKYMGFDDGIYAGVRLIEILSNGNTKCHELLADTTKYFSTEEIKVEVGETHKFDIVNKVKEYCDTKKYTYNDIDGVRVEFDDSWALVRASNTGPNLTIRFEAKTSERLIEIEKEFKDKIDEYKRFYGI